MRNLVLLIFCFLTHLTAHGQMLVKVDMNDARVQYRMGMRYFKGDKYIEQSDTTAVKWWKKSAEQGNLDAMDMLGHCYRYGEGVKQDDQKAVLWWTRAAKAGNRSAMMHLGNCYAFGFGVAENDSTAIRLFEQAAVEPKYMFVLGEKYFFGDGILTRYPLAPHPLPPGGEMV